MPWAGSMETLQPKWRTHAEVFPWSLLGAVTRWDRTATVAGTLHICAGRGSKGAHRAPVWAILMLNCPFCQETLLSNLYLSFFSIADPYNAKLGGPLISCSFMSLCICLCSCPIPTTQAVWKCQRGQLSAESIQSLTISQSVRLHHTEAFVTICTVYPVF
jgi:hypothetical protein